MYSIPDLFYVANAGNYPSKRSLFYPFKQRFLKKYGIYDGWDLQLVDRGGWESRYYLLRYWIWGHIYHLPVYECPGTEPRNVIKGLIKHDTSVCDRINPEHALFWLLFWNAPLMLAHHLFMLHTHKLRWKLRMTRRKVRLQVQEWVERDDNIPF